MLRVHFTILQQASSAIIPDVLNATRGKVSACFSMKCLSWRLIVVWAIFLQNTLQIWLNIGWTEYYLALRVWQNNNFLMMLIELLANARLKLPNLWSKVWCSTSKLEFNFIFRASLTSGHEHWCSYWFKISIKILLVAKIH